MVNKKVDSSLCNERTTEIRKDLSELREDVKKVLTNHLPHIQAEVTVLNNNFKIFGAAIPIILTIINIIINVMN